MRENSDRTGGKFRKGVSGNPNGRPRKERADADPAPAPSPRRDPGHMRADAWYNETTGVGTNRDKRYGTMHMTIPVTIEEAEDLWRGEPLAARIIETLPSEMLREGFRISVSDDDKDKPSPFLKRDPGADDPRAPKANPLAKPVDPKAEAANANAKPGAPKKFDPKEQREDLREEDEEKPKSALERARAQLAAEGGAKEEKPNVVIEGEDPLAERKPGSALERARAQLNEAGGDVDAAKAKIKGAEDEKRKAKERVEDAMQMWEDLNFSEVLWEALTFARGYGGGAILVGANDGQNDLTRPLIVERVSKVSYLHALEARECVPIRWYTDPMAPKFGKPALYRLNPLRLGLPIETEKRNQFTTQHIVDVHESRLLIFDGIRVSRLQASVTYGWGDNVLTRAWPVLRDFNAAMDSAGVLVSDFAQGVFEMKNLYETMAGDPDSVAQFLARIQLMDQSRSSLRAVLVDSEHEKFHREQSPVSGLADLIDRFQYHLAAVADMPLTLLLGMSPGGLNATGESDLRFFYDRVAAMQRRKLGPAIRYLTRMIFAALGGEPDEWVIEFAPLWQPTEKEKAEARATQAGTDEKYVNMGVLSPDEVAVNRFGGAEYSFETHIDLDARREMGSPMPADVRDPNAPMMVDPNDPNAMVDPNAPPIEPIDPAGNAPTVGLQKGNAAENPQAAAMNGAQIGAMVGVVESFFQEKIPREAAIAILTTGFPITPQQAAAMLPEGFKPKPEPAPFGGGFGGPPGAGGGKPPFGKKPGGDEGGPPGAGGAPPPAGGDGGAPPAKPSGNPFAKSKEDNFLDARADYDEDQPRAEDGRFGEVAGDHGGGEKKSGGGSGGSGGASLTKQERQMLSLRAKGVSDKKLMTEMGLDRTAAMKMGESIRTKLGLGPGGSLKEAGKKLESEGGSNTKEPSSGTDAANDTKAQHFKDGAWSPERTAIHDGYIARVSDGVPVSDTPTLYMTGGGPAAGKTVALLQNPGTGIPSASEAVHADPDSAKQDLPEYKGAAKGDKGAATRVHEESAHMSQAAVRAALAKGQSVVYDSSGDGGIEKLEKKVARMRAEGAKRVEANYATLDVEEAIRRSDARAEETGRFVPHDYLRAVHADAAKTSIAAMERGVFDAMKVWDTSGTKPVLLATYDREKGITVVDPEGYEKYTTRGRSK